MQLTWIHVVTICLLLVNAIATLTGTQSASDPASTPVAEPVTQSESDSSNAQVSSPTTTVSAADQPQQAQQQSTAVVTPLSSSSMVDYIYSCLDNQFQEINADFTVNPTFCNAFKNDATFYPQFQNLVSSMQAPPVVVADRTPEEQADFDERALWIAQSEPDDNSDNSADQSTIVAVVEEDPLTLLNGGNQVQSQSQSPSQSPSQTQNQDQGQIAQNSVPSVASGSNDPGVTVLPELLTATDKHHHKKIHTHHHHPHHSLDSPSFTEHHHQHQHHHQHHHHHDKTPVIKIENPDIRWPAATVPFGLNKVEGARAGYFGTVYPVVDAEVLAFGKATEVWMRDTCVDFQRVPDDQASTKGGNMVLLSGTSGPNERTCITFQSAYLNSADKLVVVHLVGPGLNSIWTVTSPTDTASYYITVTTSGGYLSNSFYGDADINALHTAIFANLPCDKEYVTITGTNPTFDIVFALPVVQAFNQPSYVADVAPTSNSAPFTVVSVSQDRYRITLDPVNQKKNKHYIQFFRRSKVFTSGTLTQASTAADIASAFVHPGPIRQGENLVTVSGSGPFDLEFTQQDVAVRNILLETFPTNTGGAVPQLTPKQTGKGGGSFPQGCQVPDVTHEIGHALGLGHTFARSDIETFFEYQGSCKTDSQFLAHGFEDSWPFFPHRDNVNLAAETLIDSIMSYPFGVKTKETNPPIGVAARAAIDARIGIVKETGVLSELDKWTVNRYYACVPVSHFHGVSTGAAGQVWVHLNQNLGVYQRKISKAFAGNSAVAVRFVPNSQQSLTFAATSGTFQLSTMVSQTDAIPFNTNDDQLALNIATALNDSGVNVFTQVLSRSVIGVTFLGVLGGVAVDAMTATTTSLTGTGGAGKGTIAVAVVQQGPVTEVQTLHYATTPTQGSYTLQLGTFPATAALDINADAPTIQAALEASVGIGNVRVVMTSLATEFRIIFAGEVGASVQSAMTVSPASSGVTVTQTRAGVAGAAMPLAVGRTQPMSSFGITAAADRWAQIKFLTATLTLHTLSLGNNNQPMKFDPAWTVGEFKQVVSDLVQGSVSSVVLVGTDGTNTPLQDDTQVLSTQGVHDGVVVQEIHGVIENLNF